MRKFWHNWKTNLAGLITFLAFGVSHKNAILPLLPTKYLATANTVFVVAGLILSFYAKDAGNHSASALPPEEPTHP